MENKYLSVLELFAGVGGFRVGLEKADSSFFKTVYSNQWEPSRKNQDAFECYSGHFKESINRNKDIKEISNEEFKRIDANLIVGGFPCQDYSVARTKSNEKGIEGKKGVLFWEIIRAIENINPDYLILENVDRLLKSPALQRGRDFLIMLSAFNNLGYSVEWRVINAADYGFPQRRRRVFVFVYKNTSVIGNKRGTYDDNEIIYSEGIFANAFPIKKDLIKFREGEIDSDLAVLSESGQAEFFKSGIMRNGRYYTADTNPSNSNEITNLGEIILSLDQVDNKFYLSDEQIKKMSYLRDKKSVNRVAKTGFEYTISEGSMELYDSLLKPGRTVITSEGTINRSTHIIEQEGIVRFLTPIEIERLNGFPDNWTEGMNDRMRFFCMGNALVVGVVEKIGNEVKRQITEG